MKWYASVVVFLVVLPAWVACAGASPSSKPNIVFILTDDQGYGDLGCNGNPKIRTPNIDALAAAGVRFTHFHSSPVCSPTRASLMTGRYNYRTGVVDTFMGRSMMRPDEVTLPEVLSANGYRTGNFGKWHLGDHYPLRSIDKGFSEAFIHAGGGLAQPSGPPDNGYFDPVLLHNGKEVKTHGYCTDLFTDAAIRFIEKNRSEPFFVYLAVNAPHKPLLIDERYVAPYRAMGLDEGTAKTYGMITNIDENVGRLLAKLKELDLEKNTIVMFMTDNGPSWADGHPRYNADLRGTKGTVYDGGIRVPFFVRWPARIKAGTQIDRIAAHIDVMPTLLEACGIAAPASARFDGVSLLPLWLGKEVSWPDRTLFFQWHRGNEPVLFKSCAVRTPQYKLVDGKELYDMTADPGEQKNLAADKPDVVKRLRAEYEAWFKDVGRKGYEPPRIVLGSDHENPVTLTRQDWRDAEGWEDTDVGHWLVNVSTAGTYEVTVRLNAPKAKGEIHLRVGGADHVQPLEKGTSTCSFKAIQLPAGDAKLEAWLDGGNRKAGAAYVDILRR